MSGTTTWIRPLTEGVAGVPARGEVRGSQCRTLRGLFTEWAGALGFPDHFGHNWDAFYDCLRDAVPMVGAAVVVVREAGQLLADEPDDSLNDFMLVLRDIVGESGAEPRLLLLLDDEPDRLSDLGRRLAAAGWTAALHGSGA